VPLGALLSGGIDSGTIVALAQAAMNSQSQQADLSIHPSPNSQLKTISIGFEEPGYDEAVLAAELARSIKTDHHPIGFAAQDFDDYPTIMRHLEEPQCSATAVPIYRLYQACRAAGLTVVLTGEGSDELFGGYHWHKGDALVRPLLRLPALFRAGLASSPLPMSAAARRVLRGGALALPERYQTWLTVSSPEQRHRLFTVDLNNELKGNGPNPLLVGWADKLRHLATDIPLHQTMWLETQTRLVDFINFEVDKMSMAHSIEARVPFLDHRLWEFCAALPANFKLRGQTEKYLLRQAVRGALPETTRSRRKVGLASPYAAWLRAKRLPAWAESALSPTAIQRAGLFDSSAVQQLRKAHQNGQPGQSALFMGILSTQLWFDLFIR
jgi:asparagine synthase (glutamine-hydrolysing)